MVNKKMWVFYPLLLLLFPLIGMYVSNEINWSFMDFLLMGMLILCTSFSIKLIINATKNIKIRIFIIAVIFVILFIIWAELAVGIFGTPFAGS